jgi:hypothetical protein
VGAPPGFDVVVVVGGAVEDVEVDVDVAPRPVVLVLVAGAAVVAVVTAEEVTEVVVAMVAG